MSNSLNSVLEKARADIAFAKDLFADPDAACKAAGISLNATEAKLLGQSLEDARKYFVERIFLVAQGPDVLWNWNCYISCSS